MIARLFKFNGGVHPPEHKLESTGQPIASVPLAETLVLPLRQHVGNLPKILVQPGEHVLKGQRLADAVGSISAAVHAPTSGTIVSIEDQLIPHPSGLPDVSITLRPDGEDRWSERTPVDWRNADRFELVASLRESGIVGMGGAAFPTQVKLRPGGGSGIKTLVVNGAECEPYITCDDMLMRERADEIVKGIEVAHYILGPERCVVGIEDNKPEAIQAMRAACAQSALKIDIVVVPTLYPSGDARRLTAIITGIEVPSDKRSSDVGVQVFNVATLVTLYRYLELGETVVSRVVTVTGNVARPGNFEVPLGTPMTALLAAAGGELPGTNGLIMGGPMMGFSLPSINVPVIKATNCIIASAPRLFPEPPSPLPCIRCARCADACPVSLQPQDLYWFAKSNNLEKARSYKLFDCIECGCCSYVCPSNIPLVQYYRYAKSEIIAQDKAKEAANLARERNEFRLARIEREKQERAAKHAQRAAGAKAAEGAGDADEAKKAAIAAAMERAKAQKAEVQPKNTENVSESVQAEIAAIDARREAAAAQPETASNDQEKQEN
jgi:electron transport complex protein RnfC